jgi:5-methyltetrahydropteroyltriglutamate--homocysteine methyltransferase
MEFPSAVMLGHSRSKNGVASLAYVPGIPIIRTLCLPHRDRRDKPGDDDLSVYADSLAGNGIYSRAGALLNRFWHRPVGATPTNRRNREEFMQRTAPPFRADHVGSLLRTAALKEARAKREEGAITAEELKAVEDHEIEKVIRKQEDVGLKLATDGEFRRSWWHFDFFKGLDGVTPHRAEGGIQFHGVQTKAEGLKITGKIGFSGHPMLEHFKFLKAHTRVSPKMTIPAPSTLHFRQGRASISTAVYPELDGFFDDVAKAYRGAIRAFYDAGCRYLQLDDTAWAMVCDLNERVQSRARGDDPDALPERYARLTNAALAGKPADMAITMHSCRGNFRSTFIASGGYEFVAEQLLGHTALDGYFLEYDSARAGGFEPLRFFPKGNKQLVLGLVTSKSGKLENKDDIKRRIDEATKYVDLDQLCLSPQCGFASTEEGNVLAEDEQWSKLRMIVEIADEVWG